MSFNSTFRPAFCVAAVLVAAITSVAQAAITVPSTVAEDALSSGLNTPLRNAPRAYQAYYAATQFTSVTSSQTLAGLQFKLAIGENWRPVGYLGSTWPDAPITFGSFQITLAKPTAQLVTDGEFLSLTPTFDSYLSSPVVVYNGPLTLAANSFSADGGVDGVHSFGPTISFTTPYTINPGEGLVLQIRLSGYGATGTPLQAFFASTDFENGSFDAISSTVGAAATVPAGFSSPMFVNFVVPEPAAFALVAPAGLFLMRRRA